MGIRRLFHAKVCFIAGIGFFVDAYVLRPTSLNYSHLHSYSYDIFSINIASSMIGYVNSNGTCQLAHLLRICYLSHNSLPSYAFRQRRSPEGSGPRWEFHRTAVLWPLG